MPSRLGMSGQAKIAAVVNPRSAGGRTARRWPEIARALEARLGPFTTRFTEANGATAPARALLREGFDFLIAAGGDGTVNEVANAFLENDRAIFPAARLGILPLGTGGDFRRALGIEPGLNAALETLAAGVPRRIDAGKASFCGHDGAALTRYFVNVASFGIGGEVARRSQNAARRLGGTAAFLWATFRTLAGYRGRAVRIEIDGSPLPREFLVTHVAIGNGAFQGGGMRPCPRALLDDGMLEVTVIDYLGWFEIARDIRLLYSEDVYRHPKAHPYRARRVAAKSDDPVQVEVDGEPLGRLPLEAEILPARLSLMVPRHSPRLASKPG